MPLLTHDETGAAAVARQARAARPPVRHDPNATVVARSGGPGGPPGRRNRAAAGGDGGGRKPRRRWLRWTLGVLGAMVLVPFLAFVIGWMIFKVPTADDAALAQQAVFTFDDGKTPVATVRPEGGGNRIKVTIDQVPEQVKHAVLSAEDATFYSNPGFDFTGILRAVYNQVTGGVGGGSTITQQYIKVSTGQDEATGFSGLWRKYKEIVLAVKISREQTKDQILENYLNTIYLGRGASGIQTASQAYFGKPVQQLSVSEAALLAGVIQSPSKWDPAKSLPDAQRRWNFVLDQMVQNNWLPAAERATMQFPATIEPKKAGGGIPGDDKFHIYNRAKAELQAMGITEDQIETQGLTVVTTINADAQQEAVDAVNTVKKGQPANLRYALTSIDPTSGAILAYYGGDNISFDYAGVGMRQPGSSYKPFVFAAGLQDTKDNIGLGTRFDGSSPQTIAGTEVANSEGVNCDNCTVKTAMTNSVNTVFYNMAYKVGVRNVIKAAHDAGIPADLANEPRLGIALGDQDVHPIDMAAAYATFAADGKRYQPFIVKKVTTSDGQVLRDVDANKPQGVPAFDENLARNVTASMMDVASHSGVALAGDRPVASKSGTAQLESVQGQNRDAWYVGYTPQIATSVWVGTDKSEPIKNSAGRPIYGRMLPGSIWQKFMNAALKGKPVEQFPQFTPIGDPPEYDGDGDGENGNGDGDNGNNGDNNGNQRGGDGNNDAAYFGSGTATEVPVGSTTPRSPAPAAPSALAAQPAPATAQTARTAQSRRAPSTAAATGPPPTRTR
ncbi:transglycosylase domain-containing protein [Pseudonocardia sp. CA-107938]|uniref:transglycosylase domain-containing protein n=1 Tax=Pseudonocardia sp. CA-107938 TaxID=3240021 RepID=UPI003D8BDE47